VDPKLSGAWWAKSADNDEEGLLLILDPFDKRTYLVGCFNLTRKDDGEESKDPGNKLDQSKIKDGWLSKGWTTSIGGETFFCWEIKFSLDVEKGLAPPFWFGWNVDLKEDDQVMSLRMLSNDKLETTEELEKFIEDNLNDESKIYGDGEPLVLRKIDQSQYDKVAEMLDEKGLSFE
jgi:hypothetical protein